MRPEPGRRLIRFGDRFTEGELERGEITLEEVAPGPEPAEEPSEAWARDDEDDGQGRHRRSLRSRLRGED